MYTFKLFATPTEDGNATDKHSAQETKPSWQGIFAVIDAERDVREICGAQALPATLRPLPAPCAPILDKATASTLDVRVNALENSAVKLYRLYLARSVLYFFYGGCRKHDILKFPYKHISCHV
jgi:hypothetical protein